MSDQSPFADWLDASGCCDPGLYAAYRALLEAGDEQELQP